MKLLSMTENDLRQLAPHMGDERLLKLVAIEPPDMTKPIFAYVMWMEDGTPAGWIELFNVDYMNRKAEVGISIIDKRGSIGVFRFGKQFVEDIAFGEHRLNRLTARILSFNEHAIRCAKAFGFVQEGVERQGCVRGHEFHDVILFGLTQDDWKERCAKRGRSTSISQGSQNID